MLAFLRSRKEKALESKINTAIRASQPEKLRALLSKGMDKEVISGKELAGFLSNAIGQGQIECVEELLKAGASLRDEGFNPPVLEALFVKNVKILKLLLDYGANTDKVPMDWFSPLGFAAELGTFDCFKMLLLYGADPDYNRSHRDLLSAPADAKSILGMCLKRDYEAPFVELLIQFGANMYLPDIQKVLHHNYHGTRLLNREKAHPRSLKSQCRIAIRRRLKQVGKLHLIHQLEIPDELVKYLQHHNLLFGPQEPVHCIRDRKAYE
ncbi:ankyrin repeat and SOCS box protein 12-like [Eleutherodactylus coqui]|uniref:ankyrin repeat and SOCS box protein 12-like n=1 Tax=Eleutherodactylus coqui TaxID=57060 RepID=UPI0034638444